MKSADHTQQLPEVLRYTRYYEHDGMLRAYANRSMILAIIFGIIALGSLGFAIYVRLQPPTVVRVDKDGNAEVVGAAVHVSPLARFGLFTESSADVAPMEVEGKAVVRRFLDQYLSQTPDSVDRNLAESLNMMTNNLRTYTMNRLRDEDIVGKVKEEHIISDFQLRSIEHAKGTPWSYVAFGVKEVHRVHNGTEVTDRIVGRYNLRLVQVQRSEVNPSGLLVAEYSEQQMVGNRDSGLLQQSVLEGQSQ